MADMTTVEAPGRCDARGPSGNLVATILVVDDDVDMQRLTAALVARAGYRVLQATDGLEALEVARSEHPDMILLDCDMPGMSGFEVCEQLRSEEEFVDVPVLFLTGLTSREDKVRGFDAGGSDYIAKPLERGELLARLKLHFELARSRRQLRRQARLLEGVVEGQADRLGQVRAGQNSLLASPSSFPEIKVAVRYLPVLEAGGDFYDIIKLSDTEYGVMVADVSGHDLGAAYLTGALKALTAAFTNEALAVHDTMVMLNTSLRKFLELGQYVTACYLKFSPREMRAEFGCAGHPAAVIQSASGDVRYVELVGDVLGMHETVVCGTESVELESGDRVFVYTDALIESYLEPEGQAGSREFGMRRLAEQVAAKRSLSLTGATDAIVDELLEECGGAIEDDVVLLGIEF